MPVTSLPHPSLSVGQPMIPLHIFQTSLWGSTTGLPLVTAMTYMDVETLLEPPES